MNDSLELLDNLNVSHVLLNDIEMRDQHQDPFLTILIHHYESLFYDDDDENASIKRKTFRTQETEGKQEKKNKREKKGSIVQENLFNNSSKR